MELKYILYLRFIPKFQFEMGYSIYKVQAAAVCETTQISGVPLCACV